jgi:hypothetical protein
VARPDTILAWYRKLVARKFDGANARRTPGRPRVERALEQLIVRMAKENPDWGYDRIVRALASACAIGGQVLMRLPVAVGNSHSYIGGGAMFSPSI